jgi:hypothetical protein
MADDTHKAESASGNALTFEGLDLPFNHTNEDWALANLVKVRMASLMLRDNDTQLTRKMDEMARAGIVPEMLDGLVDTKEHLEALVKLIDTALARAFVCLERLGYSPDLPPPTLGERAH